MAQAKKGDRVLFDYSGRFDDGTVFVSTLEELCNADECDAEEHDDDCGCGIGPAEIVIGEGALFTQIEDALIGMKPGERKSLVITAENAFGFHDETKIFTVPLSELPEDFDAVVGDEIMLSGEDDDELPVGIIEISDDSVTFDANHPLAGENLNFEIELIEIL
jgi:peptidylprolyl isomerase